MLKLLKYRENTKINYEELNKKYNTFFDLSRSKLRIIDLDSNGYIESINDLCEEYKKIIHMETPDNVKSIQYNLNILNYIKNMTSSNTNSKFKSEFKSELESFIEEERIVDLMIEKETLLSNIANKKKILINILKSSNSEENKQIDIELANLLEHDSKQKAEFVKAVCERSIVEQQIKNELDKIEQINKSNNISVIS